MRIDSGTKMRPLVWLVSGGVVQTAICGRVVPVKTGVREAVKR